MSNWKKRLLLLVHDSDLPFLRRVRRWWHHHDFSSADGQCRQSGIKNFLQLICSTWMYIFRTEKKRTLALLINTDWACFELNKKFGEQFLVLHIESSGEQNIALYVEMEHSCSSCISVHPTTGQPSVITSSIPVSATPLRFVWWLFNSMYIGLIKNRNTWIL